MYLGRKTCFWHLHKWLKGGSTGPPYMSAFYTLIFSLSQDHFFYSVPFYSAFSCSYLIYGFSFSSHQPKYVFSFPRKYRSISRNIVFPFGGVFFHLFLTYPRIYGYHFQQPASNASQKTCYRRQPSKQWWVSYAMKSCSAA